ncbi:MAG: hypothetical protein Q8L78_02110 [Coxiellaceae bacterium]|nr:hypothetical protein [Coxiellaceae bacterium]
MLVKKILVLAVGVTVVGATVAMAGGPDRLMLTAPGFQQSLYLDAHLGYGQSNWSGFNANGLIGQSGASNYTPTSNGNGAFAGGLDFGYTLTKNIAFEAGWFYLPTVNVEGTGNSIGGVTIPASATADVSSWMLYLAGKLSIPVMEHVDLYGKIGAGYRRMTYSDINTALSAFAGAGHYWAPVFAAGVDYTLSAWIFGFQYTYIPGDSEANNGNAIYGAPDAAPDVNLYTAFVGYKFTI